MAPAIAPPSWPRCADVFLAMLCTQVLSPYSHLDIPVIGQAYLLFRARLMPPFAHAPGEESLETALFAPEDIPFDQVFSAASHSPCSIVRR